MKTTLNLPIDISHDASTGFTYCPDAQFESSLYAPSINTAKAKLKPLLQQEIANALTDRRNYQRRVIACQNGEILIVHFRYGQWSYDIAGPGRSGCCTNSGFKSFDEAIEKAIDHANQSYGGMMWQC